jgi:hypothetical protein
MTKAFNLALLGNNVNSSGQLDLSAGSVNSAPSAATLTTTNFTVQQVGSKLYFQYNGTYIASLDSSGNFVSLANVTAYDTP